MGKYIEMPVGLSTGTPEINIPLYTLQQGKLSVPVGLSYNASGIKVEETASWTGLGWNLRGGGSINRVVRGLPDDVDPYGYMYTPKTVEYIIGLDHTSREYYDIMYTNYARGTLDIEPDVFMFSVPGYSGRFYFDQQEKKFILTPLQRIKIDYQVDANNRIKAFQLTMPNGMKYYFGISKDNLRQATDVVQNNFVTNKSTPGGISLGEPDNTAPHISAWQLMDIVSPENRIISYSYETYRATDFGRGSEVKDFAQAGRCQAVTGNVTTSYYKQLTSKSILRSIVSDNVTVNFIRSAANRLDVMGEGKQLDSIVVINSANTRVKNFVFDYDYFVSSETSDILCPGVGNVTNIVKRRLYLKSLREVSLDNALQLSHIFTYNTSPSLPNRLSASQDLWGYYNGKSNSQMIPAFEAQGLDGADRTVSLPEAMAGTLSRIQYPGGGTSSFTYESNTVDGSNMNLLKNGFQLSGRINRAYFFYKANQFQQPPGSNIYIDTFTVGNSAPGTSGLIVAKGCDAFNTISCPLKITITGITDPSYYLWIKHPQIKGPLAPGKYQIKTIVDSDKPDQDFQVEVYWQELDSNYIKNLIVGGLRVKKVINEDGYGGRLVKQFEYKDFEKPGNSSGLLKNIPVFAFNIYCGISGETMPSVLRRASQNALPLFANDGQGIVYRNVTEYRDENNANMKTEYEFSYDFLGFVEPSTKYPYPANVAADWRTGILERKREYEKLSNNTYRILTNNYWFYGNHDTYFKYHDIRISPDASYQTYSSALGQFATEWYTLDSTVNKYYTYNVDGSLQAEIRDVIANYYNKANNYTLSNTRAINSKGGIIEDRTWYPGDYNDITGYGFNTLVGKNIVEVPVKQETSVAGKLVKGQVYKYNSNGQPVNLFAYENVNPRDTLSHDRNVVVPVDYKLRTIAAYEPSKGNMTLVLNTDDIPQSIIWDYAGNYPIAQFRNADSSSIAYTSFEADGKGYWSYAGPTYTAAKAITGKRYYDLAGGPVTRSGLQTGTNYIVSYWTKNTSALNIAGTTSTVKGRSFNGWNYFEHRITGVNSVSLAGSGFLDEVKIYPANAQSVTYTYEPEIGVTSQCDAKGQISYYEYDALGRLVTVRDLDGNILKRISYEYKAPVTQ